jgi:hypothetical protein
MARFYQPDLSTDLDSPFVRDGENKLIRCSQAEVSHQSCQNLANRSGANEV